MSDEIDLTDRASFKYWTKDTFRFADLDALNHLNNIATAVYCESGRADFFVQTLGHNFGAKLNWMLANINITYLRPVDYPNDINIGTRIKKIGNSSIVLQQGFFTETDCFSTADSVLVYASLETNKSVPLTDEMKAILQDYT
ncbi:acyl-CoA thioesterase [Terasakiella pusilla]|uniref:acyl-CoA thioesterase n=1 Tax=Terasakiella pusilla TaxID=64973 RepID=UPI003AA9D026